MVTWTVQNTRVILFNIMKWHVNEFCSHRGDESLCMISRHTITLKVVRTFIECKGIPILDWLENSPDINPIANRLEYNAEKDW